MDSRRGVEFVSLAHQGGPQLTPLASTPAKKTRNTPGFKLVALKLYQTPESVAKEHYKDLASKPFFNDLVSYIVSGPVVSMVWEGNGVVASCRKLIGATNPLAAEPGTIRGDFAVETGRNCVHGSDSPENGERETALWFGADSIINWERTNETWLRE